MLRWGKWELSGGFLLASAALFYFDVENVLLWAALAAGLHEAGHWAAVLALGGRVLKLRLTAAGGDMELDPRRPLTYGGELAAILAGPMVNLILALAAARLGERWEGFYLLAGLSLSLGWFNLLPIYPLDGGRALLLILTGFLSAPVAARVTHGCSLILTAGVLAAGGTLLRRGAANLTLLCMGLWLLAGLVKRRGWADQCR